MEEAKTPITSLVNQEHLAQLQNMGYSQNVAEKALFLTQNSSLEAAVNWIAEHQGDADFEEQLFMVAEPPNEPEKKPITPLVNQEVASQLQEMGFSKNSSEKATFLTENAGIEAALKWIEDHQNDPDFEEEMFVVGEEDSN